MQHDSGKLWLDGDVIRYRSKTYGSWKLPVQDLRIVGEATNEDGPSTDDYWFCIAVGPERWFEASFYADGREECRHAGPTIRMLKRLHDDREKIAPSLAGRTWCFARSGLVVDACARWNRERGRHA